MIEKILHFSVPKLISPEQAHAIDLARKLHPHWQVRVWQDPIDSKEFVLSEFWPRVNSGAQLADLIRIEAVFNHGGIYIDSDVTLHKALDDLAEHLDFFVASEDGKVATNAVFGATKHHPALRRMIDDLHKMPPDWSAPPNVTTGPFFFSRILKWRKDVTIIPRESFYPYNWNEQPGAMHPQTYGVHEWSGSWKSEPSKQSHRVGLREAVKALHPEQITRRMRNRYFTWRKTIKHAVRALVPRERSYSMSGGLICQTIHGYRIMLDGADVSITPEVVQQGCYEPQEERFLHTCVKGGDFFIDVGANVGVFALLAASLVGPFGRVFAYEPNPSAADMLAKSAVMNWMHERLIMRRAAVGSMAGEAELGFCPSLLGGASIKTDQTGSSTFARTAEYVSEAQTVIVPIVALDEEFPYDIPIKFLKIDAEGYELQVLTGANRLLTHRCIDYIMLEAVPEVAGDMWPALMEKIMKICSFGYEPYTLDGDGSLLPTNLGDIANGCGLRTRNVILKAKH